MAGHHCAHRIGTIAMSGVLLLLGMSSSPAIAQTCDRSCLTGIETLVQRVDPDGPLQPIELGAPIRGMNDSVPARARNSREEMIRIALIAYGVGNAFVTFEAFKVWGNEIHSINAFFKGLPISTARFWPSADPVPR